MKITGFETIRLGEFPNLLWLHIHTDEGLVGLGETFFGPRAVEAQIHETCRDHVPTFPQRSPPSLLTTAACGGLRSAPDCRTRRALLHLPYSCAPPCGPAILVTQDPIRTSSPEVKSAARSPCRRPGRLIVSASGRHQSFSCASAFFSVLALRWSAFLSSCDISGSRTRVTPS